MARRVLPVPPTPVSVTSRVFINNRLTSATSDRRSTNVVTSAGSRPGHGCARTRRAIVPHLGDPPLRVPPVLLRHRLRAPCPGPGGVVRPAPMLVARRPDRCAEVVADAPIGVGATFLD